MSIVAFKNKSKILYGSQRSGREPGGYWLKQGPHTPSPVFGNKGFSLEGKYRSRGYIGKTMHMSQRGTPFKGMYPVNFRGDTKNQVMNINKVLVEGTDSNYIKPPVLSNRGMLAKKYRWINSGVNPNYVVKPNYTGNQPDTKSQGVYIHDLTTSNMCVKDTFDKYVNHIVLCSPTLCRGSAALFSFDDMVRNGPYTKRLNQAMSSSEHTTYIQKDCNLSNYVGTNGNGAPCAAII